MEEHIMSEKINDLDLEKVDGGAAKNPKSWENFAKGTFVNYGNYIVYTVAAGDALSGIAIRFGVTVEEIATWNNIKDVNVISVNQKLTIYARILR
jgi:spore germination protein YaaH